MEKKRSNFESITTALTEKVVRTLSPASSSTESDGQNRLPESGLLRLWQILGDRRRGVPPLIPISKSSWWAGVKSGRYPKPVKLSDRCTCWRVEDIRALINR